MVARLPGRRNATPEDDFCITLARFLALALPPFPDGSTWWSHIGHGKQASKRVAGRLKAMGLRPGLADYIFLWPRAADDTFTGIGIAFLEAKAPKGSLSDDQKEFRRHCHECGIPYGVSRTLVEAEAFLRSCHVPLQYTVDLRTGAWRRL